MMKQYGVFNRGRLKVNLSTSGYILLRRGFTPLEKTHSVRGAFSNGAKKRSCLMGFTFVETIVVLTILSVVFGAVLYFLVAAKDTFFISNAKISLQQDLRRCLTKMAEELSESSIDNTVDQSNNPLNFVQRDEVNGILKCIPQDSECVYYVIKFKKPISWNSQGEIDGWSDYIIYTLSSEGISRQEGSSSPVNLVSNISLVSKASGHGYTHDPNSLGSGFERLTSNRLKISLVAQRESHGRAVRVDIGSNVYLRN